MDEKKFIEAEHLKWIIGKSPVVDECIHGSEQILSDAAARGFSRLPGQSRLAITTITQDAKTKLSQEDAKLYSEQKVIVLEHETHDLKVATGYLKLAMEKYKSEIANTIKLEISQMQADFDKDKADIDRLKSSVEAREVNIMRMKASIEQEANIYRKLLVDAEDALTDSEKELLQQQLETVLQRLGTITSIQELYAQQRRLITLEKLKADKTKESVVVEKELLEYRKRLESEKKLAFDLLYEHIDKQYALFDKQEERANILMQVAEKAITVANIKIEKLIPLYIEMCKLMLEKAEVEIDRINMEIDLINLGIRINNIRMQRELIEKHIREKEYSLETLRYSIQVTDNMNAKIRHNLEKDLRAYVYGDDKSLDYIMKQIFTEKSLLDKAKIDFNYERSFDEKGLNNDSDIAMTTERQKLLMSETADKILKLQNFTNAEARLIAKRAYKYAFSKGRRLLEHWIKVPGE